MQVTVKSFEAPPIDKNEVLRYARSSKCDESSWNLVSEVTDLACGNFCYRVCYAVLPFSSDGRKCDFSLFCVESEKLALCLGDARQAIVFAATVGVGIDRLISKYSRISPSKALMLQALGTERIEALCNSFCIDYELRNNVSLTPRFSAGYGDCPLDTQKQIFTVLDCPKNIGLTLNDSMLMSPTKSVTAFVGIKEK